MGLSCILWYLSGALYLLFCSGIVYKLHMILNVQNSHLRDVPMVVYSKAPCGARYDRIYLNKFRIYIVGFLLTPIRLLMIVGMLVTFQSWTLIIKTFFGKIHLEEVTDENGKKRKHYSFEKEQSTLYWNLLRGGICCSSKIMLFISAFWITKKKLKISDFFADYGKYEEKNKQYRAPIVISNHVTAIDMFFFMQEYDFPSFMAMQPVKNMPVIGTVAQAIQTIFINRKSQESKTKAMQDVKDRISNIMEHKNFPGILIFPEGATNNGQEQMKFKYGAFDNFSQIKIYCIAFKGHFTASFNLTNELDTLLLQLSQWYFFIDLYELDTFDPQYTLDRHGITKDDPNAVDLVIEDVRYLYECAFGMRVKNNTSYAERNVMEWHCYNMKNGLCYKPANLIARSDRSKVSDNDSVKSNVSDHGNIEDEKMTEAYKKKKQEVFGNSQGVASK